MDVLLPSFIRVLRKLDTADDLIPSIPDIERRAKSDPSSISSTDRIRILDFPDEDEQEANIAQCSSHIKSELLCIAAENPTELTTSELDLLRERYWLRMKWTERKPRMAASEALQAVSQEHWKEVTERLKAIRAPLYADNERQAIENAALEAHSRIMAASDARRTLQAEKALDRAQPWVKRMWAEEKGGNTWGYAAFREPLDHVDRGMFEFVCKNANNVPLTEEQKVATFIEEFECRKDLVIFTANGATGAEGLFAARWRVQYIDWPGSTPLGNATESGSFQQTVARLRQRFRTIREMSPGLNPSASSTSTRDGGLHNGILLNVFLYYDKDSIDSILSPTGFYDDMWCYAIDPDFEDDFREYIAEESEDVYPGYLKVRIQQLVNRFFEARKYHEESLSMEQLWMAAQRSRNHIFVSWKEEEVGKWKSSHYAGSILSVSDS